MSAILAVSRRIEGKAGTCSDSLKILKAFPQCSAGAVRSCLFGGHVQSSWTSFSQQYAVASSDSKTLRLGNGCVGDTTDDPVGATFDEIYNGSFNYVVWNDQFYQDPQLTACGASNSCSSPWGHSKGMIAWNDSGDGIVLQVTTPGWPGAGSATHPRSQEGNTLGCTVLTMRVIPMLATSRIRPAYKPGAWDANLLNIWPSFADASRPPALSFTLTASDSIGNLVNRWKIGTNIG